MKILIKETQKIRLGFLLTEEKLLGVEQLNSLVRRIGGDDSVKKKIQIMSLHRNVYPFNLVKDFGNLRSVGEVSDLYRTWLQEVLNNIHNDYVFVDNPNKGDEYLDLYIDSVIKMGDKARPLPKKRVGEFLMDYLNKHNIINKKINNIYNPVSDDIIFENDDIIIMDGNDQVKCTMYSGNERWCINRKETGYFDDFKNRLGAKIFFVLQKKITSNEHKLVIIRYKDNKFSIADRTNNKKTKRAGLYADRVDWSIIEKEINNLRGLKKYFI